MAQESFNRLYEESIRKFWTSPSLSDYGGGTLTYGEVGSKILFLQAVFEKMGLKAGEKIALVGRNSAGWATTYLATVTYGAVAVPILADFHIEDVQHIVNHSDSRLLFACPSIYEAIDEEKISGLEAVISLSDFSILFSRDRNLAEVIAEIAEESKAAAGSVTAETFSLPADLPDTQVAAIIYTSGTSGFSKGAMLPFKSLKANVDYARENLRLEMAEKMLAFLPLAHAYACSFDFLFPFTVGCHITFLGRMPIPKILTEAFAEVRPSLILFVPLILEKLYKKRLAPILKSGLLKTLLRVPGLSGLIRGKIRRRLTEAFGGNFYEIIVGGAVLNQEVEAFLKEIKLPVTVGYGMTECGPLISYAPWREHRPLSVGRVIDCLEVRIDSPDPEKVVGEILVRGENVMEGYYKNEELTREALDEDGWLHTGDLGLLDEDGFLYIKGRSKNLILGPSGQNIYPEGIESKLNALPFIQESLVLEESGVLVALVYPDWEAVDAREGGEAGSRGWLEERMEENRREVNQRLPAYMRITRIRLHGDSFEKTPTHKIKRYRYLN